MKILQMSLTVLLLALAALLPTGCASMYGPTVKVGDQTYRALTKDEEETLVEIARRYLKKNTPRWLSVHECDIALRTDPDLKVNYTGDRCGEARVTWEMPTRWLSVLFVGPFLEREMYCILESKKKMTGLIDCRPKLDPSRFTTPVFPADAGSSPSGPTYKSSPASPRR